ncbi:hypothetical protein SLEP1_g1503 [Rubroshorea leprosula]|uniref:Uncharacterized protein n=1 Tax=Rubroshorea leprosula TaxID=152421 RepID=A0AAV5HDZ5_9ROSI|nr:hypothetical protein SLEP1_g1503 [Rubroshorea leprosula]
MTRTGKVIEPLQKSPQLKDVTPSSHEDDLLEEPKKEVPIRVPFPQALKTGKISDNQGTNLCQSDQGSMHHVKKIALWTEQVSAVIEQRTPSKCKDPGCRTIACQIGSREFGQALLDLGASVNLMPYSVYL